MKNFPTITFIMVALGVFLTGRAFAGQGASRMLYTVPTNTFIENVSGDNVVTINDTSGSIPTLQTLINSTRSANPSSIIIIHLMSGAMYWVNNNNGGLVLGSQECLIGSGALIQATNSAVTNALITISNGSTNVSIAGGTLNAASANIYGIYAPSSSAHINIDKVIVRNCGQDCIQLNGQGDTTFDNEMTVTRCDTSGSPGHAGISFWNATQAVCVDNNCHSNSVGVWLGNCADSTVVNNTCNYNTTGIDMNSGKENNIANNTCDNDGTGIIDADSDTMVASDSLGSNTVAGIDSTGTGNFFIDNLFTAGNATNFISAGTGNYIVPYQGAINAPGQNYFYPPLINNQHTNIIVNGLGRYDLTNSSTAAIDTVQSLYNAAISANPGDVIVLHLNGTYTVGANPLTLYSNTCILLGGEIEINSSTTATTAIQSTNPSQLNISISGGIIDGGNRTGHNAIFMNGSGMVQVDGMTLQNFGPDNPRVGSSDVVRFDGESNGGKPPYIATRCTINGGAARGIWSQNDGIRGLYSDNTVSNVNMDGVDCDSGTSGALVKFNNLSGNVRYGVFFEQRDTYDCAIGNICNDDGRDLNDYNNDEPGSPVEYNSDICNSCLGGGNGMRSGSTGVNGGSNSTNTLTSDNFFFDNVAQGSTGDGIESDQAGTQNYYSQNYLAGNATEISTSGSEAFFNSPDVSGYEFVQDSHSGLNAVVTNASTTDGAAVILGPTNSPSSGQWSLIPTDSGYYQLRNKNSGLDMVVMGASTSAGAPIVQWAFGTSQDDQWMPVSAGNGLYYLVNRHSGLYLDVPGASTSAGTQLDQQTFSGGANQQFNLLDAFSAVVTTVFTLTWTGETNGVNDSNWNIQGDTNWVNSTNGAVQFYQDGSPVTFDDSAPGVTAVNLQTSLQPTGVTVSNNVKNYLFAGSGNIGGSTMLLKEGNATLTNATANKFTGGVELNGGILNVDAVETPGTSGPLGTGPIYFGGGTLQYNTNGVDTADYSSRFSSGAGQQYSIDVPIPNGSNYSSALTITYASALSSSGGSLTKNGNGSLALSAANTFTGPITINNGQLRANNLSAFNGNPITETADGTQVYHNSAGTYGSTYSIMGYGVAESDGITHLGAIRMATAGIVLSNTVTLTGNAGISARGSGTTGDAISGQITGNYGIQFGRCSTMTSASSGTITLSNTLNNWTGDTTVADGTLKLGAAGVIPDGIGYGNVVLTNAGTSYNPGITNTVLDLNGYSQAINGLSNAVGVTGSTLNLLWVTNSSPTAATLTVGNNNAAGYFGGIIGGPLSLTKTGSGTQTLTGVNTYTGNTTINSGTLALSGAATVASPGIIIAGGAEFNVSALSSPFNLAASQTLSNSVSTSTSLLNGNINTGSGTLSLTYDYSTPLLNVLSGTLTLSSDTVLKINNTVTPLQVGTYPIITGSLAGAVPSTFTLTGDVAGGTTASLQMSASALNLVISPPIPRIMGINLRGITLTITATNGEPNEQYVLLQSTNLLLPFSQWTPVLTNVFDGSGNLDLVTNVANPNSPQMYYLLQVP